MASFSFSRNLTEVDKVIAHAKFDRVQDFLPESQVLGFSIENELLSEVRLLEVDQTLAESLGQGQEMVFR